MDINVLVTMLTIAVVLLSIVVVTFLVIAIAVLVQVRRLVEHIDAVTHNIAQASQWLDPAKVIGHISRLFRKR